MDVLDHLLYINYLIFFMKKVFLLLSCILFFYFLNAQDLSTQIDTKAQAIQSSLVEWRRHIHQNPELGNREFKTSTYIVQQLKGLGLEIKTGIAKTGVVAILKGDKPGPCIALRADMDALPVKERVNIPFASKDSADT